MSATVLDEGRDITASFLDDDERDRYRHINSDYGHAIALGLRDKPVWQGTFDETAYRKRRAKNRVARRSRAINRQAARR